MSLKDTEGRESARDPAGLSMGFTMVPHYAQYFWRPYLGMAAFALWELLLSFCYGSKDTAWPSISRLSRTLTNSDNSRHVVRGRLRRDHGRERFVPGALQVLEREGIVRLIVRGADHTPGYLFKVRKSLPLLSPEQVSRLSPALQREHARFLARAEKPKEGTGALGTSPDAWDTAPDDADTGHDARGSTKNNYQEDQVRKDDEWEEVKNELRLQLDESVWAGLIQLTAGYLDDEGEVLTITSRNRYSLDCLEHRYANVIQRAARQVYGQELELRFEWREEG